MSYWKSSYQGLSRLFEAIEEEARYQKYLKNPFGKYMTRKEWVKLWAWNRIINAECQLFNVVQSLEACKMGEIAQHVCDAEKALDKAIILSESGD